MEQEEIILTKKCSSCKKDYSLNNKNFDKNNRTKDGYVAKCKKCRSATRKRKHINIIDNQLYCPCCLQYKDKKDFNENSKLIYRDGYDSKCKSCKNDYYLKDRIRKNGGDSLEGFLNVKLKSARERAKKNKSSLDFDLQYIIDLWNKQKGICALSGLEMTTTVFNGRTLTNVSIDRIDSNIGYTKDNIQLVCMVVNQMKSNLTMDELLYFCKAILNTNLNEIKI